jgi:hypothetical protein
MRRDHSQDLAAPAGSRARRITIPSVAHEIDARYGLTHLKGAVVERVEQTPHGFLLRLERVGHDWRGRIDVLFIRCEASDLTFIRGA